MQWAVYYELLRRKVRENNAGEDRSAPVTREIGRGLSPVSGGRPGVSAAGRNMSRRRRRPGARAAVALLLAAAVGMPVAARVLSEIHTAAALVLPTVIFVVGLCLLCPRQFMPVLALAVTYLGELAFLGVRGRAFGASALQSLLAGQFALLAVPVGAVVLGHVAVLEAQSRRLWWWRGKTNLRLLLRRPGVLVRAYRWPLAAVIAGAMLDTVTTMRSMYRSGVSVELHPAMRVIAEELGVTWGVPLASVVRLGFVFFVAAIWRKWCGWLMVLAGAGYVLAAASNYLGWL